jgi:glyoxylase-like metal-dependent hydrolase (beta-lactamase superfamily II)
MTKRAWGLAVVTAVALGSMAAAAAQAPVAPAPPKTVTVDKLKDNLYVLKGGGGNTALFLTAAGAVVVDTKLPGWGQPLLDAIKGVTSKPVTMVINTHAHYDHTNGQVEFPASVEVVAHENTKLYMTQANPVYGLQTGPQPNIFTANGGRGLAARTFKDTLTIGSGADRIDLHYFGRAHTGGDTYVVFPALGVMHVGDTFPTRDLPIMDLNNGGSGVAFAATLAQAAAMPGVTTVINGHNATTMTPADVKLYAEFIGEFVATVQAAKKAGKSVDDVVASWQTPAKYTGYAAPQVARVKADAEVIFTETK